MPTQPPIAMTPDLVRRHLDRFAERTRFNAEVFAGRSPDYFDSASGQWTFDGFWTEGFWPGLLWLLADHARDPGLAAQAEAASRRVIAQKEDMDDHDLGFLFYPACVLPHELGRTAEWLPAALVAARRLAARFRPGANYIPAHGPRDGPKAGFAIIDTAMNLPLLLWAGRYAREAGMGEMAIATARTILREHLRADGSTCQVLWLDPDTGRTVRREAVMAATVDSTWARGQAWGIHGIAQVAEATGEPEFREAAERMARYFLMRLPADGVTFHDLDDPAIPHVPRDTSAQAIAAGGLLILARLAPDPAERRYWIEGAERLLWPLFGQLAPAGSADHPRGILTQGCKSLRKQQGIVSDIVFGDYYFVEALVMWLRMRWR